jgi:zinc ribbon protein
MFCIHCGAPNPNDASFCSTCGKAIDVSANPAIPTEIPQPVLSSAEGQRNLRQTPPSLPAQPPSQWHEQYQARVREGRTLPWILVGFAACLVIVLAMALVFRQGQAPSGLEIPRAYSASETPATAAATGTLPATAPATTDTTPAAPSAPVQAPPPPAAPQNTIVGDWKTATVVGSHISLHFGADGRYTLTDFITDEGVYVYSSGDGTLRLQSNSFFSKGIMVWSCQLSGDSFSCVDPEGAGHVYSRVQQ